MEELRDRVAVVTGGASGIGLGMARAFAGRGMKLVLGDVEAEPLEQAVAGLRDEGASVIGVRTDVSDQASVDALRDDALAQFGAVHVLCNNAGVGGSSAEPLWNVDDEEWDWVVGVNVKGVLHGVRAFVPVMLEQDAPAHVVSTASMAGLMHGIGVYGITKHAVVALSETLWAQLQGLGGKVGVSVLCPGWVRTRIMESERNRPEAPRRDPGPMAALFEAGRKMVAEKVEQGLDPLEVGELVADSILEKRFYVLTHPDWKPLIETRMRTILEQRDPVGLQPPEK